jgi:hypothetical protein
MQLRQAERKQAKIKMALQGPSGSGKTYSSLLLAKGLVDDWRKIAVIDTENSSADLYAHLGPYQVLPLQPPLSPEAYTRAIQACEEAGVEVIIIDSISHCWDFLLEYHAKLQGNSFTNWNKVTPRQKAFIQTILQSSCHIIATMRVKQDYVLNEKNGKHVPEKVGLKAIQRDGVDYEFTIVFDLDLNHLCKASKDRTGLFIDQPEFMINTGIGKQIRDWCSQGTTIDQVKALIDKAHDLETLNELYFRYKDYYDLLENDFKQRKAALSPSSLTEKMNSNGFTNHQ